MATGRVKWFDSARGYGFITPEDDAKDVFVHFTGISGEGYRSLEDGTQVSFDVVDDRVGKPKAVNVVVVKD
jgi:CspA family cold shock protein